MKRGTSRTDKTKTKKHWEEKQYEGRRVKKEVIYVEHDTCPVCNSTGHDENGQICTICSGGHTRAKRFFVMALIALFVVALSWLVM